MKNYFPHDSDARSDDKIIALRIKHKWEGYGLYWALIEKLRESKDYMLKADYNVIAFDLRSDAAIIKSIINDFGLFVFTENGEYFYSESLIKRMKPLDDKKAKLSEAGKKGNQMRWKENQEVSPPNRHPINNQSPPDNHPIATQSPPDCHPIAQLSQDKIRLDKIRLDNNNIINNNYLTPTPPLKGGGGKKKNDSQGLNAKARKVFEEHYRKVFESDYYWTSRDAGSMTRLIQKLRFQREQKQMGTSDDEIIYALQYLLSSIQEGWIFENFSVSNINSKFNEIVSHAKYKPITRSKTGMILTDNSTDKYNTPAEKKWEERWKQ